MTKEEIVRFFMDRGAPDLARYIRSQSGSFLDIWCVCPHGDTLESIVMYSGVDFCWKHFYEADEVNCSKRNSRIDEALDDVDGIWADYFAATADLIRSLVSFEAVEQGLRVVRDRHHAR